MSQPTLLPEVAANRHAVYPIDPHILNRWSPRSFLEKPVGDDLLYQVLEAARWAPSGSNVQPWRFIVANTAEKRERFLRFINPSNAVWCSKAPVLLLLLSKKTNDKGDHHRSHAFDTGAAWAYLALEAARLGLITHAMGGFNADAARTELHIPEEYEPQVVVALGERGPIEALSEAHQAREMPNSRRPLSESIVSFD